MIIITREEVLKLAHMSRIEIRDDEIEALIQQLQGVLNYAQRVIDIAAEIEEPGTKNINVFREDVVIPTDPELSLQQAPDREGNFFVVPAILEQE
jgi:aspartyl-tRNA(Asn)/glutamyl-tRNA(Gln) amidotransferase subunit C